MWYCVTELCFRKEIFVVLEACRPGGLREGGRRNFEGEVSASGNGGILTEEETGNEGELSCWERSRFWPIIFLFWYAYLRNNGFVDRCVALGSGESFSKLCEHKGSFINPILMACILGGGSSGLHFKVAANGGVKGTMEHAESEEMVERTCCGLCPSVGGKCSFIFITENGAPCIGDAIICGRVGGRLSLTNILGRK